MTASRFERVAAVIKWLWPIAEPVANEAEFSRWIRAGNADPDEAEDWCAACARAEVARLNEQHPEHDYYVWGGCGIETDCPPTCCKCGKTLTDILTGYAIRGEVDHYSRHTVSLRGQYSAERAFRFIEVFESPNFDTEDSDAWRFFRKVERMFKRSKTEAAAMRAELEYPREQSGIIKEGSRA